MITGWRVDLAIIALLAVVFFTWLGRVELLEPDEARHAEIAREMLVRGEYLAPELQGAAYHDKPAAYYWIAAGSLATLGNNEIAARLPSVFAALIIIACAARFAARYLSPAVGRLVAIALATTPFFVVLGRYGILDMSLAASLTIAFTALGAWWIEQRNRPPRVFYVFIGVAVLLKGPVAIAQAAVAVTLLLVLAHVDPGRTRARTLRSLGLLGGLATIAVVAAPWYASVAVAYPDYLTDFLWSHNVERYAALGPGSVHSEPWWYYVAALPLLLLPWTPWVISACRRLADPRERSATEMFCAVWAISLLAVYLPAKSRLVTYLLPALVPLVCMAANRAYEELRAGGATHDNAARCARRWSLAIATFSSAAATAACVYVIAEHPTVSGRLWITLPAMAALPIVANLPSRRSVTGPLASIAVMAVALLAIGYGVAGDVVGDFKRMRVLAEVVSNELPAQTRLHSFHARANAAAFYSAKLIPALDTPEEAIELLRSDEPVALVMRRRHLSRLQQAVPPGVVERWSSPSGVMLLSNVGGADQEAPND